jgi:hypothetical protein
MAGRAGSSNIGAHSARPSRLIARMSSLPFQKNAA